MSTQMQKKEMTAREATEYSRLVASEWAEENADLLTCFHGETVNQALFGLFASTHRASQPIHYDELSRGFLRLFDSKVLIPEFPIRGVAAETLEEMRNRFAPASKPATQPSAEKIDPNDFAKMTSEQFEKISTSDARRLYRSNESFRRRADALWQTGGAQ